MNIKSMAEKQLELKCRLCGVHESESPLMINMFQPENCVPKIHKVLPISISEYDPLPKNICYRCHHKVDDFYNFREQCVKTQELLKSELSWFNNSSTKTISGHKITSRRKSRHEKEPSNCSAININCDVITVSSSSNKKTVCDKVDDKAKPTDSVINKNIGDSSSSKFIITSSSNTTSNNVNEDSRDDDQTKDAAPTSHRENLDKKKEKLTLTIRKNDLPSQSWPVSASTSTKRKSDSINQLDCETNKNKNPKSALNADFAEMQKNKNPKSALNADFGGSNFSGCNSKENDGKISNRNSSKAKSEVLRQDNSNQVTAVDNTVDAGVPDYLMATHIPLAGTVYTCLHCEQTFVSKTTACTHRCEKLMNHLPRTDCSEKVMEITPEKPVTSSPSIYTCEVCSHSFSRHASLIAHQSAHLNGDSDNESDGGDEIDENVIFFGQKKKKRKIITKKILVDDDGNYMNDFGEKEISVFDESESQQAYRCVVCDISFSRRASLYAHISVHLDSHRNVF